MSSAMGVIQEAEQAVQAAELEAKEKASVIIAGAQKKADDLMTAAKQSQKELSAASILDAQKKAEAKLTDGEKESEAAVFREKESALSRKDGIVDDLFQTLVNATI